MKRTTCPHCGQAASPLGMLVYTKWTGYRCSTCQNRSRFDPGTTTSVGIMGVLTGVVVQSVFDFHGPARLVAILCVTVVFVAAMSLFVTLRPMQD